jgi:nicotinamidase-related amidase
MEKALIVIDYTNDFVATDGALTAREPAQSIEGNIVNLCNMFVVQEQYIVVANDFHKSGDEFHPESKLFPPHNIVGTEGRELYGNVKRVIESIKPDENCEIHFIDKTRYSAFAGTDLELRLRERGINEIHLCGVCTDICVLHTAIDAYNKGFKIVIHKDAVASFNPVGHEWALEHFKGTLGAEVR